MPVDLSPPALLNAGGGLFFAIVGVIALVLGWRGARRARLVGGLALSFGLEKMVENLLAGQASAFDPAKASLGAVVLQGVLFAVAAAFAAALVVALLREAPPRARRVATVVSLALLLAFAGSIATFVAGPTAQAWLDDGRPVVHATIVASLVGAALTATLHLLVVACAARASGGEERWPATLALAFGLFAAWIAIPRPGITDDLPFLVYWVAASLAGVLWVALVPRGRRVAWTLLATSLAGVLFFWTTVRVLGLDPGSDAGTPGILRTLGALLLAVAIFRHDLLGVELPRLGARRGTVGAGAFALVIITTQVAENFLEARYGLLLGGVVAGAFLFAAAPVQRLLERPSTPASTPAPSVAGASHKERSYVVMLRKCLAEGGLSKEEEIALMHLADELGISAKRAMELRYEVEESR